MWEPGETPPKGVVSNVCALTVPLLISLLLCSATYVNCCYITTAVRVVMYFI